MWKTGGGGEGEGRKCGGRDVWTRSKCYPVSPSPSQSRLTMQDMVHVTKAHQGQPQPRRMHPSDGHLQVRVAVVPPLRPPVYAADVVRLGSETKRPVVGHQDQGTAGAALTPSRSNSSNSSSGDS